MQEPRRDSFTEEFAASTLVEVHSPPGKKTLVEVEAVAYLGKK